MTIFTLQIELKRISYKKRVRIRDKNFNLCFGYNVCQNIIMLINKTNKDLLVSWPF